MAGGVSIPLQEQGDYGRTEGTRTYAIIVCLFSSLGGIFFGYDQGVTGGVLVMDNFVFDYCVGYGGNTYEQCTSTTKTQPSNWSTFTTMFSATYYMGCILGAGLAGYISNKYGRRISIFTSGLLFCIGTLWVALTPDMSHGVVLAGRFFAGIGVGNSSFALPIFAAECAPKELRGLLSGFMQMTVTIGLLLANIFNYTIDGNDNGWRYSMLAALPFPVIVMGGIFCIPESPRWTYQTKGKEKSRDVLQRLRRTEHVDVELNAIGLQIEHEGSGGSWNDIWVDKSIRKRLLIAMSLQFLQQASGVNPVFTYGGQIFQDISGDGLFSLLLLTIVNCVTTIPALYLVDAFGRRFLLLWGAVGMTIGHAVLATIFTVGCDGNTEDAGCSKGAGIAMMFFTCVYVFSFAIAWGPVPWIYAAEIFPVSVRSKAVSVSTMTNWIIGTMMIWVAKLFPLLNVNGVFYLFMAFTIFSFFFVWVYCPETKGLLLEDIEEVFDGKRPITKAMDGSPKFSNFETPAARV